MPRAAMRGTVGQGQVPEQDLEILTLAEIARWKGVTYRVAHRWSTEYDDFPEPVPDKIVRYGRQLDGYRREAIQKFCDDNELPSAAHQAAARRGLSRRKKD